MVASLAILLSHGSAAAQAPVGKSPNRWGEATHLLPLFDTADVRGRLVDAAPPEYTPSKAPHELW